MSTLQIICCVIGAITFIISTLSTLSILSQVSQYDNHIAKLLKNRNKTK
jgi:hypothetical protein